MSDKQSEPRTFPTSDPGDAIDALEAQGAGLEEQRPPLTPEAQRALAEAEARRKALADGNGGPANKEKELGGQKGPEPTRFGDWEKGGIISDF